MSLVLLKGSERRRIGSAFHQLCPRNSGALTPTASMAIRLWETFTCLLNFTEAPEHDLAICFGVISLQVKHILLQHYFDSSVSPLSLGVVGWCDGPG